MSKNSAILDFTNFLNSFLVKPGNMKTIPKQDKEIFNRLDLANYKAVVAGGAALSWYQNREVDCRDIDIWFPDQESQQNMSQQFLEKSYKKTYDSVNAETYNIEENDKLYKIQLIKNQFHQSIDELVNRFDITVCRIATDGNSWWFGENFMRDFTTKQLVFEKTNKTSVKRLLKYWTYGFQPSDKTLEFISNGPDVSWDFTLETDEEYADAI